MLCAGCGEFCCNEEDKGTVRLLGGRRPSEGYVELCQDGAWGTLCDQDWDGRDAGVICQMLGYHRESEQKIHKKRVYVCVCVCVCV